MSIVPSLVAVVLAAGGSRRFGGDKRRHPIGGKPLLQRALATPLSLGLPTILVLKPEDQLCLDELLGPWLGNERLSIVYAERAVEGMGHSLAAAATAAGRYDGLLVMLGDMPYVSGKTLRHLCDSFRHTGISVPRYRGMHGHPVLFARRWFRELEALSGDSGARAILSEHPEAVSYIEVDDPGILRDVDHPPA